MRRIALQRKFAYREGDWFGVPLKQGGFALGLVARTGTSGVLLGYFFGPRRQSVPTQLDAQPLSSERALMVCQFGDLGIATGEWPIICSTPRWNRADWPVPAFGHIDAVDPTKAYERTYDEEDMCSLPDERPIGVAEALALPRDGLWGHRALQGYLSRIIA